MADEPTVDQLQQALAERDEQIRTSNERLSRMEETLNALRPPPPAPPGAPPLPPGKRFQIPQNLRQQIAGLGLSDQEIEKNGDLIVPFLQAYLGQAAGEVLAIIQQQADDIAQLTMLRDIETYPHADTLFQDITKIRKSEQQAGRYVPLDVAYRIAVANNIDKISGQGSDTVGGAAGGQFGQTATTPRPSTPSPAAVRSRDVSQAGGLRPVRAAAMEVERPVKGADDLMGMSREERKQFFAQHSETPIR